MVAAGCQPGWCVATHGSCMGWRGVPMEGFWPAVDGTMQSGCGTRARAPVRRSCGTPMASLPFSRASRGVPMENFWPVGAINRGVQVWEATTGTRRWVGRAQLTRIRRVAWSPDGTHLASCGDDGGVCRWEASDGMVRASLQGHRGMVMRVAWSPDGRRLASGGGGRGGGELYIWDAHSGERLYTLSEPSEKVYALAWSPSGSGLVSGGSDGIIRWWDLQCGAGVRWQKAHHGAVQWLMIRSDGRRLAHCGTGDVIKVRNPRRRQ